MLGTAAGRLQPQRSLKGCSQGEGNSYEGCPPIVPAWVSLADLCTKSTELRGWGDALHCCCPERHAMDALASASRPPWGWLGSMQDQLIQLLGQSQRGKEREVMSLAGLSRASRSTPCLAAHCSISARSS